MKNFFTVIAALMLTIAVQAQDTLKVGSYTLVTYVGDSVTQYVLFSESEVVDGYLVPIGVLGSKQEAIDFISEKADIFYSGYGVKEVEAREMNRQARIMRRFVQSIDSLNFTQRQLEKYSSQLAGEYILVYKKERTRVTFTDRLVARRKGAPNLRMRVYSNNNIELIGLEIDPLPFYANKFGDFWGVGAEGENIRLIKIQN